MRTDKLGTTAMVVSVASEQDWIGKNALGHMFAIIKSDNDELIGNCGFNTINQIWQCGEVGIFIGDPKNRGKGYGTEALTLLLDYGFDYLNLNNMMLKVFEFNERAINCYIKLGFKEIGRRRQVYQVKGKYHDQILMDIIRTDKRTGRE